MKKRLILVGTLVLLLVVAVSTAIWISQSSQLPIASAGEASCATYGIEFDASSVVRLYQEPDKILGDPETFWSEDPAYSLLSMSPWHAGRALPPNRWTRYIERISGMSDSERKEDKALARSMEIMDHADVFCQGAIPVIASLLPEDADLSTKVYLSAFTDPANFAIRSNIVMDTNVLSYWGKTSKFFNLLGHELFHIGYFDFQPYQTEVWSDYYPSKVLLTTLQNDGLAVYTQYLLSDIYPAPAEIELLLLENKLALNLLIDKANDLFGDIEALDEAELMRKAFTGVNQRALYVVGAHVAMTIDEELGRDVLVETVRQGPRSFIERYNEIAEEGTKLYTFPKPETLTAIQVLRRAAVQGDNDLLRQTIADINTSEIENPGGETFEHLSSTGLLLLKHDQASLAVDVFQSLATLFPNHPDSYLYLGDAFTQAGNLDEAEHAYQRALEIDPRNAALVNR